MERCRVCPGRTGGAFVVIISAYICIGVNNLNSKPLLVFNSIWSRDFSLMLLLPKHTTTMALAAVRLCSSNVWNAVMLNLDEQDVRLHWCVFAFHATTRWGFDLALMCGPNTLRWRWRGVRLSSLNVWNGVILAPDEQSVRLFWCVN